MSFYFDRVLMFSFGSICLLALAKPHRSNSWSNFCIGTREIAHRVMVLQCKRSRFFIEEIFKKSTLGFQPTFRTALSHKVSESGQRSAANAETSGLYPYQL
jgi:hypothetical protein